VHLLGLCRKTSYHNIMGLNHVKRRQLWICSISFLYLYQLELLIKEEGNGRPWMFHRYSLQQEFWSRSRTSMQITCLNATYAVISGQILQPEPIWVCQPNLTLRGGNIHTDRRVYKEYESKSATIQQVPNSSVVSDHQPTLGQWPLVTPRDLLLLRQRLKLRLLSTA
jgi:hypothetical protein